MGLMRASRHFCYVWSWRARYWFLDTQGGRYAHFIALAVGCLVVVIEILRMLVAATIPPAPGEPAKAFYWWVVQIIIAIVAAAIAMSMRPKAQQPAPQSGTAPTVQDGLAVKDYFGTCWIEDEFLLAWKNMGTVPIKTKSGKK